MILFYNFFNSKKVIFVNTPLQFLNVLELENIQLNREATTERFVFVTNSTKNDLVKIREIKNFYNLEYYHIYNVNFFLTKVFLIILLKIREVSNYKIYFLIIGNYTNAFLKRFLNVSKIIYVVDDGTNFFDKNDKKIFKKKNVFFFTFINYKIFKKYKLQNVVKNNFLLIKSKLNIKKKK